MNAAEKIAHAAERKAFETMLDSLIRKSQTKDVCTVANDFVNMVQKIHSSVWTPETFEMLHQIANDPDSKWAHYAERLQHALRGLLGGGVRPQAEPHL